MSTNRRPNRSSLGNYLDAESEVEGEPLLLRQNAVPQIEEIREDITEENAEYFGNQLRRITNNNTLRIGFININGFPESAANPKNKSIFNTISTKQIGILGIAELNKCWHLLNEKDKWKDRTRGWWESSHCVLGYNCNDGDIATPFQPGGTAVLSINTTCHRIIESGKDSTGLGRWSWSRYRGKHNVTLRIISAYRPCKPSNPGPNTAYSQQQRYLDRHGDHRCPRDAILEDLGRCVHTWRALGDQIILMADFNEDVEGDNIKNWYEALQLQNAISHLHNINNEPTFHIGTKSIDAILISHTISPLQTGYLPFGSFPSDHRCIWLDISMDNAFGFQPPKSSKFAARRLKNDDPNVRSKWLKIYEGFIHQHNLHTRQFRLEASIQHHLSDEQIQEYEDIRELRMQGIKLADSGCRKLKMGNIPSSDAYKKYTDKIELWKAVVTKKRHCRYSQSKLRRLEKATGVSNSLHCTIEEARTNESQAYAEYWEFKNLLESIEIHFWKKRPRL
jgi:hypothetical protein